MVEKRVALQSGATWSGVGEKDTLNINVVRNGRKSSNGKELFEWLLTVTLESMLNNNESTTYVTTRRVHSFMKIPKSL